MARSIENNPYLADPEKRAELIRRQALESSIFEGATHLTEKDLLAVPKARAAKPRRKTA